MCSAVHQVVLGLLVHAGHSFLALKALQGSCWLSFHILWSFDAAAPLATRADFLIVSNILGLSSTGSSSESVSSESFLFLFSASRSLLLEGLSVCDGCGSASSPPWSTPSPSSWSPLSSFPPAQCAAVLNSIRTTEKLGSSLPACVWE